MTYSVGAESSATCIACDSDEYSGIAAAVCVQCPSHCTTCSDVGVCLTCVPTYYLNATDIVCWECDYEAPIGVIVVEEYRLDVSARVSWAVSPGRAFNVTSYNLYMSVVSSAAGFALVNTSASSLAMSVTVRGLVPSTNYWVRVTGVNLCGDETGGAVVPFATIARPSVPSCAVPNATLLDNTLVVVWNASSGLGGPLMSYTVGIGTTNAATDDVVQLLPSVLSHGFAGLIRLTTYFLRVFATNRAGPGGACIVTTRTVDYATPPRSLTAPTQTILAHAFVLSWLTPSFDGLAPIWGYNVYVNDADATAPFSAAWRMTQNTSVVITTNRARGSSYAVVGVVNRVGETNSSQILVRTIALPSAPFGVLVRNASILDVSAVVSWNLPEDFGDAPLLAYLVFLRPSSGGQPFSVAIATGSYSSSSTLLGLLPRTNYDVLMCARNRAGNGANSSVSMFRTAARPAVPTGFSVPVSRLLTSSLTAVWTATVDTGDVVLDGYALYVSTVGASGPFTVHEIANTSTSVTLTGLQSRTHFWLRLFSVNRCGESTSFAPADAATIAVTTSPAGVGVADTTLFDTSLVMAWSNPIDSGDVFVDSYSVYISSETRLGPWMLHSNVPNTSFSVYVVGLTARTNYWFMLEAFTRGGAGVNSSVLSTRTIALPSAPEQVGVPVSTLLSTTALVVWTLTPDAGDSVILTQHVYSSWVSSTGPWNVSAVGPSVAMLNITSLAPLHNYWVRVSAVNRAGEGLSTAALLFRTIVIPDAPTSLSSPSATLLHTSLAVTYVAPVFSGEAPILSFSIYRAVIAGGPFTLITSVGANINEVELTELSLRTNYFIVVTAVNRAGESQLSSTLSTRTIALPGAPTNLAAPASTLLNSSFVVTWSAPADDGDASVNSYVVYVGAALEGPFFVLASPAGAGLSASVSGLAERVTRYITVSAHNRAGEGANSSVLVVSTIARPTTPTFIVAPVGSVTKDSILLSWQPPLDDGSAPVWGYRLYNSSTASVLGVATDIGNVTSFAFLGLRNATVYFFRVVARNRAGFGVLSLAVNATTDAVPSFPVNVLISRTNSTSFVVNWASPLFTGGAVVSSYLLLVESIAQSFQRTYGADTFSAVVGGLIPASTYLVTVRAVDYVGIGDATVPAMVSTNCSAYVPPFYGVVGACNTAVGGDCLLSCAVDYAVGAATVVCALGDVWVGAGVVCPPMVPSSSVVPGTYLDQLTISLSCSTAGAVVRCSIDGTPVGSGSPLCTSIVLPGGQTTVRARAFSSVGVPGSELSASYELLAAPKAPHVSFRNVTGGAFVFRWTADADMGGLPLTNITVFESSVSHDGPFTQLYSGLAVSELARSDKTFRTSFWVKIDSANVRGHASTLAAVETTDVTPATAPLNVTFLNATGGSIAFGWVRPRDLGGAMGLKYALRLQALNGSFASMTVATDSTSYPSTTHVFYKLNASVAYQVRVIALSQLFACAADGDPAFVIGTTGAGSVTRFQPNASLTATSSIITASWDPALDEGGVPVLQYYVFGRAHAVTTFTLISTVDGGASRSVTWLGLTGSTLHYVMVLGRNAAGNGSSSVAIVRTAAAVPPIAPGAVTLLSRTGGTISLQWPVPLDLGGAPLLAYRVFVSNVSSPSAIADITGECNNADPDLLDRTCTAFHFRELTEYVFLVAAINSAGEGPRSVGAHLSTAAASLPGAPAVRAHNGGSCLCVLL